MQQNKDKPRQEQRRDTAKWHRVQWVVPKWPQTICIHDWLFVGNGQRREE